MLLSGSMEQRLSKKPGEIIRLRGWSDNWDTTYYAQLRGYLKKMPGLAFSDFQPWKFALVSEPQYLEMMQDYASINSGSPDNNCTERWVAMNETYQWVNGIPKS